MNSLSAASPTIAASKFEVELVRRVIEARLLLINLDQLAVCRITLQCLHALCPAFLRCAKENADCAELGIHLDFGFEPA